MPPLRASMGQEQIKFYTQALATWRGARPVCENLILVCVEDNFRLQNWCLL